MTVLVAGVSGSGKTTIGKLLAAELGWQFTDGDALHPAANIAKMASGQPLTDADRAPWLRAIGERIDAEQAAGRPSVVACSALKRRYRAELLGPRPGAVMTFLLLDFETARRRLAVRHGHFFEAELLSSQYADLEPPEPDEAQVLPVEIHASEGPDAVVARILSQLGGSVAADRPGTSA